MDNMRWVTYSLFIKHVTFGTSEEELTIQTILHNSKSRYPNLSSEFFDGAAIVGIMRVCK